MTLKNKLLIILVLINSISPVITMERPPQPPRAKRALETPSESKEKYQVPTWKPVDNQLVRLAEPQRLIAFQNIIYQTPTFNFWSWENNALKENWPADPHFLEQNAEIWHNARELLVNQIVAASPNLKNQLATFALNNQGHFGVKSLIYYFASALFYNPGLDLENLLKPILKVLVANANPQQRFEAIYSIVKMGVMDPDYMNTTLNYIIEAGINPNTPDQYGRNIIQYIQSNTPGLRGLPLEELQAKFSQYPS